MKSEKYALALCQNPQPRCPVHLLVDCSTSMEGKPIEELHQGVDQFFNEVDRDPFARLSVEATVIAFGYRVHALVSNHSMAGVNFPSLPRLEANGSTPMGGSPQ